MCAHNRWKLNPQPLDSKSTAHTTAPYRRVNVRVYVCLCVRVCVCVHAYPDISGTACDQTPVFWSLLKGVTLAYVGGNAASRKSSSVHACVHVWVHVCGCTRVCVHVSVCTCVCARVCVGGGGALHFLSAIFFLSCLTAGFISSRYSVSLHKRFVLRCVTLNHHELSSSDRES